MGGFALIIDGDAVVGNGGSAAEKGKALTEGAVAVVSVGIGVDAVADAITFGDAVDERLATAVRLDGGVMVIVARCVWVVVMVALGVAHVFSGPCSKSGSVHAVHWPRGPPHVRQLV
jgi:hypothetical protein